MKISVCEENISWRFTVLKRSTLQVFWQTLWTITALISLATSWSANQEDRMKTVSVMFPVRSDECVTPFLTLFSVRLSLDWFTCIFSKTMNEWGRRNCIMMKDNHRSSTEMLLTLLPRFVSIRRVNTSETDEESLGRSSADLLKISLLKVVLCDICTVS